MANKTVLEKQIQAYGQFQSTIRKMSKEDQIRYASEGPLAKQREMDKRDLETRRAEYARELKAFDREKPMFGNTAGLTPEQVRQIADLSADWTKKRKAFDRELRKKYGFDEIR